MSKWRIMWEIGFTWFISLDDVNMNLTGMFDMLLRLSEELEATKQRQLVTEKELNATREILKIGSYCSLKFVWYYIGNYHFVCLLKIWMQIWGYKFVASDISFSATLSVGGGIAFSAGENIVFKNIISNIGVCV